MRALAVIVLSPLLATCSSPPSLLEQIVSSGELRVVTQNTPTTYYYGTDAPRGIEYDLARGFAGRLGVELRIVIADQVSQVLPDVASRKAQIGAAGLAVTEPRRRLVDFGPAYQDVEQQIIYRRGSPRPSDVGDLVDGRLEVVAGSSHVALLERARKSEPLLNWTEEEAGTEELLRRVAAGEIDHTIIDSNVFALLRHAYPEARAAFGLGSAGRIAWAVPKGATALREKVAAYFAEIEATGELERILDRYYFASRDFDYVGSRAFVRHLDSRLPSYRDWFREAGFATAIDWRLLAAMAYQESHWNPSAVSPTGVRGMMMLTERTAGMMQIADRRDARGSIVGGAGYFRRVLRKFPARIPEPDRTWFAVAAYNLGWGHVEDARIITEIQGGDPDSWEQVRERLPLLSDERWHKRLRRGYAPGSQAVLYVDNVRRYYELLLWMAGTERFTDQVESQPLVPAG